MARSPRRSASSEVPINPRPLPPRANLDKLRNEAKAWLAKLRASDPAAKLADAQYAVAKQYGFASWRKLKAHVDALREASDHLLAVIRNHDAVGLQALLTRHPEMTNTALDEHHHSPLHHAAGFGNAAVAEVLLAHGASLDMWCAAGLGKLEAMGRFFDNEGQVKPGASTTGSTRFDDEGKLLPKPPTDPVEAVSDALYIAARNGHAPVVAFLLDHGADINFRGYDGGTPLFWAAARWPAVQDRPAGGQRATVELLLARGADPNIPGWDGQTALHYVERVNNRPIAELLRRHGAMIGS